MKRSAPLDFDVMLQGKIAQVPPIAVFRGPRDLNVGILGVKELLPRVEIVFGARVLVAAVAFVRYPRCTESPILGDWSMADVQEVVVEKLRVDESDVFIHPLAGPIVQQAAMEVARLNRPPPMAPFGSRVTVCSAGRTEATHVVVLGVR